MLDIELCLHQLEIHEAHLPRSHVVILTMTANASLDSGDQAEIRLKLNFFDLE